MLLPVFKPYIRRTDMDSVLSCLISDQIGPGEISATLVKEIGEYLECANGVLLRDHYRAVSISIDLLGLSSGDKVIISPLAPGIYMDVLKDKGIIPLFADVDSATALMKNSEIERFLKKEPRALILYAPLGQAVDLDFYHSLDIPILEDISENLGSSCGDIKSGTIGHITLFSMESDKILTCGGGSGLFLRKETGGVGIERIHSLFGEEIFLSDINAALALTQFRNIEENLKRREELGKLFLSSLRKTGHSPLIPIEGGIRIHYSFPVLLESSVKEVKAYTMKKNIEVRKAFSRTALEIFDTSENICPFASSLMLRTLLFPLYPSLGRKNGEIVSRLLSTLP